MRDSKILVNRVFRKRNKDPNHDNTNNNTHHGPQQKGQLERIVKGNPVKHQIDKDFHDTKNGKNHPIHKPLRIITLCFTFNRLKGLVGGVAKAHQARERRNAHTKDKNQQGSDTTSNGQEFLGYTRLFLCGSRKRVMRNRVE